MARQIIKINVKTTQTTLEKAKADILAIGLYSKGAKQALINKLDTALAGEITRLKKIGDFKGEKGTCAILYTRKKIAAERVLLLGLGEKQNATADTFRCAASKAALEAVKINAKTLAVYLHDEAKIDLENLAQAVAEGIHFGGYKYDEFVTQQEDKRAANLSAAVIDSNQRAMKKLTAGVKVGQIVGQAQNFARTLCNRPGNVLYPAKLAAIAKKIASSVPSLNCTVLDEKKMAAKKMNAFLAVAAGAMNKPRMIILKYTPRSAKNKTPVALVGKAITFDSGGISLKPSADMHEMKMDMTGGAAVLMTMEVIAKLKLPVCVYGIICAAENKPDGASTLPGDIVTTYSGKTVEILNTDAEGRLVLADGIHHAKVLKCKTIVDIATLTGACIGALGKHKAGLLTNNEKLAGSLEKASAQSGEPLWRLPCTEEYADEIKGKISDLKNIGSKYGGASTGAAFLEQFAKPVTWAHLDIAPKMNASQPMTKYTQPGSVGFGVRLLSSFIMNLS